MRVAEAPALWASNQADSFESLVAATGTVFVGEVTQQVDRDVSTTSPKALGPKATIPVTSFEVRLTKPIVGSRAAGETVVFDQPYGVVEQSDGPVMLFLEGDSPLEVGKSYLFFASAREDGTLTSAPFARFEIEDNGELKGLEGWTDSGVARALAEATVSEAEARLAVSE
jgi:hypothetical protein